MITGPFTRIRDINGKPYSTGYVPTWLHEEVTWYRQTPPYKRPLTYSLAKRMVLSSSGDATWESSPTRDTESITEVTNKCRSKFVEAVSQGSASWGVNLAEARQAESMLVKRVGQLARFVRDLKRLDFRSAARELGWVLKPNVQYHLKRKPGAKALASNFLEFHFGWEPLIKDIGESVKVLAKDFLPAKPARARSTVVRSSTPHHYSNDHETYTVQRQVSSRCLMQAEVIVESPNFALLNALGLDNLAGVAWELVPWSFVADWFGNLGQVLSQWSDFNGVRLENSFTTTSQIIDTQVSWNRFVGYPPDMAIFNYSASFRSVYVNRSEGISTPVLQLRPFEGFSPVRGATAVALLVGLLPNRSVKK